MMDVEAGEKKKKKKKNGNDDAIRTDARDTCLIALLPYCLAYALVTLCITLMRILCI